MKYVRTKDNIYEIVNDYGSSCAIKSRGKRGKTAIDGFTIKYGLSYAPRANTVEELCDEFVKVVEEKNIITRLIKGYFKEIKKIKEIKPNKITIYGAIWTDKGLIYVAKMNEKGEFELL